MATVNGQLQELKKTAMLHAAQRWAAREAMRSSGLARIDAMGPGAADTQRQVAQFMARESQRAAIRSAGFQERIIRGDDLVLFAPSTQAATVAAPVARITTLPGAGYAADGIATGLLLPGGLLLTNFHVFPGAVYARDRAANFGFARDERGINQGLYFELDPDRFYVGDPELDFAIVAVAAQSIEGKPLSTIPGARLIESTGKTLTGLPVNIVQHPGGGPRKFGVSNNRLLDILPQGFLHYETDTEPGSSGSPAYNREWELIALHHSGVPRVQDGQVMTLHDTVWQPGDPEDDIDWVANEGTRVSFLVQHLRGLSLPNAGQQAILATLLEATHDPLAPVGGEAAVLPVAAPGASPAAVIGAGPGSSFNFTGPVTIHVYSPQAAPAAGPPRVAPPAPAPIGELELVLAEKKLVFDPDYAGRKGYDPAFLGTAVPLPTVGAARAAELYSVADYQAYFDAYRDVPEIDVAGLAATDPVVLAYHHYSLVHNKRFRMCTFAASNCDYRAIQRQDTRKRSDFGGEDWRFDPRVPAEFQLGNSDVYGPAKRVDRGHIVRREDNCWGKAGSATEYANADSYHWSNCTPQHEAFNQESPADRSGRAVYKGTGTKGIWGQFESRVQGQIEAGGGQATVFAGPVLKDFFEARDWGDGKVSVPKRFWKIVVVPEAPVKKPKLLVYGYLFSQENVARRFGLTYEERILLPEFDKRRESLARLSELTGLVFPKVLLDAEQPV